MKIFFKFKAEVGDAARGDLLRRLSERGATRVAPLFPRSNRPGSKQHYLAEADSAADARKLVEMLRGRDEIAFAHRETKRRPLPRGGPED